MPHFASEGSHGPLPLPQTYAQTSWFWSCSDSVCWSIVQLDVPQASQLEM